MFAIILATQVMGDIAPQRIARTRDLPRGDNDLSGEVQYDELIEESDEEEGNGVNFQRIENKMQAKAATRDLPGTEPMQDQGPMQGQESMQGPVPMMQGPVPMMQGPASPPNENGGKRWYKRWYVYVFGCGVLLIAVSLPICFVLYSYCKKHSDAKERDEERRIMIRPQHSTRISAKDAAIRLPIRARQGERESTAVETRRQHESTAELPLRRLSKDSVASNALGLSIPVKRRRRKSKESVASNSLRQSVPVKRRHHVYTDSIGSTRAKQSKVKSPPEAVGEGKPGKANLPNKERSSA